MVSKTSIKYLALLREALKCPYRDCESGTNLMENTVTLPCGHHFCYDCAIDGIDRYDGCTVCQYPCWGRDAKANHTLNRMIEQVEKLSQLATAIQKYEHPVISTNTHTNGKTNSAKETMVHKDTIEMNNHEPLAAVNTNMVNENEITTSCSGAQTVTVTAVTPSLRTPFINRNSTSENIRNNRETKIGVEEEDDDDIVDPSLRKKSRSHISTGKLDCAVFSSNGASMPPVSDTPCNENQENLDGGEDILSAHSIESVTTKNTKKVKDNATVRNPSSTSSSSPTLTRTTTPTAPSVMSTLFGTSSTGKLNSTTESTPLHTIMPPPPRRLSATVSTTKTTKVSPRSATTPSGTPSVSVRAVTMVPSFSNQATTPTEDTPILNTLSEVSKVSDHIPPSNSSLNPQYTDTITTIETDDDDDDGGPLPLQRRSKLPETATTPSTVTTNKLSVPITTISSQGKENKISTNSKSVPKTKHIPKPLTMEPTTPSTASSSSSSVVTVTTISSFAKPTPHSNQLSFVASTPSNTTMIAASSTPLGIRSSQRTLDLVPSSSSSASSSTISSSSSSTTPSVTPTEPYQPLYGIGGANRARQTGNIVVCATGMTTDEERDIIISLGKILPCTIVEKFDPSIVTHIVTVVNPKDTTGSPHYRPVCPRTLKYVQGLLCGCWIVSFEWARRCCSMGTYVDESIYEIARDRSARKDCSSPILYRQWTLENRLPLFYKQRFYILEPLHRLNIPELFVCIQCGGGIIETVDPGIQYDEVLKNLHDYNNALKQPKADKKYIEEMKTMLLQELERIQSIIVITSFDSNVRDHSSLQRLEQQYTKNHRPIVTVVDQLWFLDCVSNGSIENMGKWSFGGEGIKTLRKVTMTNTK